MMMPMQLGQGMGMQMPMMGGMSSPMIINGQMMPGMPQGIMSLQGGQSMMPMAMQGPNGQMIMVMPMPQQLQGSNQQTSNSPSTSSQSQNQQNIQTMMTGGMPIGTMIPGL